MDSVLVALLAGVGAVGVAMLGLFLYATAQRPLTEAERAAETKAWLLKTGPSRQMLEQLLGAVEALPFPTHLGHAPFEGAAGGALCDVCIRQRDAWNAVRKAAMAIRERTCPCPEGTCEGVACVRCDCLHGPRVADLVARPENAAAAGEPPPLVYRLAEQRDRAEELLDDVAQRLKACTCGVGPQLAAELDGRGGRA